MFNIKSVLCYAKVVCKSVMSVAKVYDDIIPS